MQPELAVAKRQAVVGISSMRAQTAPACGVQAKFAEIANEPAGHTRAGVNEKAHGPCRDRPALPVAPVSPSVSLLGRPLLQTQCMLVAPRCGAHRRDAGTRGEIYLGLRIESRRHHLTRIHIWTAGTRGTPSPN